MCIKPFVVNYDYGTGKVFTADETYIKIRGVKAYIWFIMDASKRSIIGNQVSDNRGVGPCILAMRMAFRHLKKLPENFHFIADGYSAYPLAAQQFFREFGDKFKFDITQVIGLTNDDEVSRVFRPYKQRFLTDLQTALITSTVPTMTWLYGSPTTTFSDLTSTQDAKF